MLFVEKVMAFSARGAKMFFMKEKDDVLGIVEVKKAIIARLIIALKPLLLPMIVVSIVIGLLYATADNLSKDKTVLIVDDDPSMQAMLGFLIGARTDAKVLFADDCENASQQILANPDIRVVIVDGELGVGKITGPECVISTIYPSLGGKSLIVAHTGHRIAIEGPSMYDQFSQLLIELKINALFPKGVKTRDMLLYVYQYLDSLTLP